MKLSSSNCFPSNPFHPLFYKATTGGIQKCVSVTSDSMQADDRTWGYVVDSLYVRTMIAADYMHFDHPNQGFFTEESEAIEFHRELVLSYINGLNNSTLKTCPIDIR